MRKLRIAMIGLRGIPATYGGVERHVEELATRLVKKGHDVTVFCRSHYTPKMKEYKGVKIIRLPTIVQKHFEMIVHALFAVIYILFRQYDIVHVQSVDPALLTPLLKIRHKVVVTSHGQGYRRVDKWGMFAKAISKLAEKIFIKYSDAAISVSKTLKDFYMGKYGREVVYIPNGISIKECENADFLKKFGLEKNGYILYVGRLIPTKGSGLLIEAYKKLKTDLKLVIVGGSSHTDGYELELRKNADGKIIFLGYQYGEALNQLYANCKLFVFPSQIEGLPIVLLEALSFGVPVIFSDIPEDMEIAGGIATPFKNGDINDLYRKINEFLHDPNNGERLAKEAKEYVAKNYNWDMVVKQTEAVYNSINRRKT